MNPNQRDNYLQAMQIDTWIPRVSLPYAALSEIITANEISPTDTNLTSIDNSPQAITHLENNKTIATMHEKAEQVLPATIENKTEQNLTIAKPPKFSLQLMKAGSCLLLIELPQGEALQIHDKSYQLLRNILHAAKLPDSPEWLGDIIHWPLFKQASIPQGNHEAKEFLQSFIKTYQEQLVDIDYLWLIGDAAITYAAQLNESNYYQTLPDQTLGQLLIIPSLDKLLSNPNAKAKLWQQIKVLIPSWQT